VNAAYFKWKYENNPYMPMPLIYMALHQGKIIGMRGFYGAKWEMAQPTQTWPILCTGDSVVATEYRRRGIFTKISEAALKDLASMDHMYVFSLSLSSGALTGSMKLGWRSVGHLQIMTRESIRAKFSEHAERYLGNSRVVRSVLLFPDTSTRPCFHHLDRNIEKVRSRLNSYVSIEESPRPGEMAELIRRIGHDGRIRHIRDENFFRWRFKNPLSVYRFIFWKDTKMEGYLVLQTRLDEDNANANIIGLEAINARVRSDLLHAAVHFGHFDKLAVWSASLQNEEKTLLKNYGFKYLNEKLSVEHSVPMVFVMALRDALPHSEWLIGNLRLLNRDDWDLRMIYSDNF
jgi:hypothetical protein